MGTVVGSLSDFPSLLKGPLYRGNLSFSHYEVFLGGILLMECTRLACSPCIARRCGHGAKRPLSAEKVGAHTEKKPTERSLVKKECKNLFLRFWGSSVIVWPFHPCQTESTVLDKCSGQILTSVIAIIGVIRCRSHGKSDHSHRSPHESTCFFQPPIRLKMIWQLP